MRIDPNTLAYSNDAIAVGNRLADIPESKGGWAEYFDPKRGLDITDSYLRGSTAVMLENAKRWMIGFCKGRIGTDGSVQMNEAIRAVALGGYSDYLFPIIRASFAQNAVNDLVSVQPTMRRVATVTHMNWIYGSTKGGISKGTTLSDALTGIPFTAGGSAAQADYTSQRVTAEIITASTTTTQTASLTWVGQGIIPGSVSISATMSTGAAVLVDNGSGGFIVVSGTVTISSSSINYATGAISITTSAATFDSGVTTNYVFNSEGAPGPEVQVTLRQVSKETERRNLSLNYSAEAAFDFSQEYGTSIESIVNSGASELINMEIANQLVREMWNVAPVVSNFSLTVPSGVTLKHYFEGLMYQLEQASSNILLRTQRGGGGNWLIVDTGAANILASLGSDMFKRAPSASTGNVSGVHYFGELGGRYKVYRSLFLRNESGASSYGNILMGWKGNGWEQAGLVYAPYQTFYTTDTLTTSDFVSQKGYAARYAVVWANRNFYARINVVA